MKKLNKIALSVVAMVAVVISGCGADEKNAPVVNIKVYDYEIYVSIETPFGRWQNVDGNKKMKKWLQNLGKEIKIVYLEGKRSCADFKTKLSGPSTPDDPYFLHFTITPPEVCPPKDRLNKAGYKFGIKTGHGTFCYDTSDKKSYDSNNGRYKSVSCNK